ncbi:MAG: response regulator [Lachnospiraceae bacterium]|nr:response regulator [Lachnospiraceae bacterium]
MRVLIVDDNYMICRLLQQQIDWTGLGCEEPDVAHNGVEAIEKIENNPPDIVISDVRMPVMDGMEFCQLVSERWPQISLLFMSAYEDFAAAQMAIRHNVKDYILKPFDRERLGLLENVLRNIIKQREHEELHTKIIADEYLNFLVNVIEERNVEALEDFLGMVHDLGKVKAARKSNIWPHLIKPIFAYRYSLYNQDPGMLAQEEQRMGEELATLGWEARVDYLRGQYQSMMREEADAADCDIVIAVRKVIKDQFASPQLNIHMLGRLFHMSPTYLGRIFLERTGMKLVDYITEKRMQYACEQLSSTLKTVKEIAEEAGYSDANYFSRAFRRKTGMSPVEYRVKYRNLDEKKLWESVANKGEQK